MNNMNQKFENKFKAHSMMDPGLDILGGSIWDLGGSPVDQ